MSKIDPMAEWKRGGVAFALLVLGAVCLAYYKPIGQTVAIGFGALCIVAFFAVSFEGFRVPLAAWIRRKL